MKALTFYVTLSFSEKIVDDEQVMEVAKNIARAIELETGGLGIAPNCDTYTTKIEVIPQFTDETVTINLE